MYEERQSQSQLQLTVFFFTTNMKTTPEVQRYTNVNTLYKLSQYYKISHYTRSLHLT